MSIFNKIFQKSASSCQLSISTLCTATHHHLHSKEGIDTEPLLLKCRLADYYRSHERAPISSTVFESIVFGLEGEDWQKLGLLIKLLDEDSIRQEFSALLGKREPSEHFKSCFVELAKETGSLSLKVLKTSNLRVEEFIRHFVLKLGATIEGEEPNFSQERLAAIDYSTLVKKAERAKDTEAERVMYLRKLQDEQEQMYGQSAKL